MSSVSVSIENKTNVNYKYNKLKYQKILFNINYLSTPCEIIRNGYVGTKMKLFSCIFAQETHCQYHEMMCNDYI